MSDRKPLRFRVDVHSDAKPISGSVRLEGMEPQAFAGWTELFVALEGTIADARTSARADEET